MDYFVIFMGGTGGRCMETLGYALSAGLLAYPKEEGRQQQGAVRPHHTVHVLSIDSDKAHRNVKDGRRALRRYESIRGQLRAPDVEPHVDTPLFDARVSLSEWIAQPSGFELDAGEVFRVSSLAGRDADARNISDLLFTGSEQEVDPRECGFRAHPNVGAAMMHAAMLRLNTDAQEDRPYLQFRDSIERAAMNDGSDEVRVLLVGSIFGGTGAASFPTIAGDIRRHVAAENLRIGAVMLGKYFEFDGPQDAPPADGAIKPQSENFEVATMEALRYYSEGSHAHFDDVYLLGAPIPQKVERRDDGGDGQWNPLMYVELEAALACAHFFEAPMRPNPRGTFPEVLYRQVDVDGGALKCSWGSLAGGLALSEVLARMLHCCVVYANHYAPEFDAFRTASGVPVYFSAHIKPYMDAFANAQDTYLMELMRDHCAGYLNWFLQLSQITRDAEAIRTVAQQYINLEQLYRQFCRPASTPSGDLWSLHGWRGDKLLDKEITLHPRSIAGIDKRLHAFAPKAGKPEHRASEFYHYLYANCVKDDAVKAGKARRGSNG